MMHPRSLFYLLAGLALLPVNGNAQEFQLQDQASLAAAQITELKPKTIVFADQPSAKGEDVFISYEDWAKAKPVQQQLLSLYPGFTEPNTEITVDGTKRRYSEKLHMYVAEARFVVAKPQSSINLTRLATLPFAQQLDPAIKHRVVTADEVVRPKESRSVYNQNPQRRWCEGRPVVICMHSTYKLEGRLPTGIALANKIRDRVPVPLVDGIQAATVMAEGLVRLNPRKAIAGTFRRPGPKESKGLAPALADVIGHRGP